MRMNDNLILKDNYKT